MKTNIILGVIILVCIGGVTGYMIASNDWHEGYDMHDSMHEHMEDDDRREAKDNRMLGEMDEMGHMDHSMMMVTSERDFLEGMIPHHQEAIDTAQEVLARGGGTPEIIDLVNNIIVAQEKEIADMKAWYLAWYGTEYVDKGNYQPMMRDLSELSEVALDKRFLEDMVMHHMGAIMMAESVRPYIEHEEITDLAEAIVKTQSSEIELMRKMLKNL